MLKDSPKREQLFSTVLETRCIQLHVAHPPDKEAAIEIADVAGTHIGAIRVAVHGQQACYLNVYSGAENALGDIS